MVAILRNAVTIGVELELVIMNLPHDPSADHHYALIAEALKPLGKSMRVPVYDTVTNAESQTFFLSDLVTGFQVQQDLSIMGPGGRWAVDGTTKTAEIATPIMRCGEWMWVIPDLMEALSERFKLHFNSSTGLHVHIGIGRDYTLIDLKKISKAIIIFETAMDRFHPQSRRDRKNLFIKSNRESPPLAKLSNIEMIAKIDQASTYRDILCTVCGAPDDADFYYRNFRYNLTSIIQFGTIEFRQAIGTADSDWIVDWISRITSFIMEAAATADSDFEKWAMVGIADPDIYVRFGVPIPALD